MAKRDDEDEKEDLSGDGTVAVNDAWTGMLAVSLLALGIASGLLFWDYNKYDSDNVPKPNLIGTAPKAPAAEKKDGAGGLPVGKDKDKEKDKEKEKDKG